MKGTLTHMKRYTFWWSTKNAILYDDVLILYDKDIKDGTKYNVKQDNCVAKINEQSHISFHLFYYLDKSGEYEFKAQNKEERSKWVDAINKSDTKKLLYVHVPMIYCFLYFSIFLF